MKFSLSLILVLVIAMIPASLFADDTVEKTDCKLAIGYDSMDELKADLLASAKREVINELFGELIIASTAVENFVVTSDQIRASSIGFVRVDDNAEFYNGDSFVEACVTISAYVTEEDRTMFVPEKLEKKFCDSDDDLSTSQLIAYVKDEVIIQSLVEFEPKLKGANREDLLQLVQKVKYIANGFIPDTQTYCAEFEGYVVPVEIMAFLETKANSSAIVDSSSLVSDEHQPEQNEVTETEQAANIDTEPSEFEADGITASSRLSSEYDANNARDGDENTAWRSKGYGSENAWVEVAFRSQKTISRLGLYRQENPEFAQVKAAILTFADGSQQEITFKGLAGWDYVDIEPVTTDWIKFTIITISPEHHTLEIVDLVFFGE